MYQREIKKNWPQLGERSPEDRDESTYRASAVEIYILHTGPRSLVAIHLGRHFPLPLLEVIQVQLEIGV